MTTKKIGILTTYFASNYGAMLQPFALKRTLEKCGYDVEMIRYKQKFVYNHYNPFAFSKFFSPWWRFHPGYPLRVFLPAAKKELAFRRFMHKYINKQKGFCSVIPYDKDFYIIGSDQLWRKYGDVWFDDVYLGFFPTKPDAKKFTYAVSGEGMEFSEENIARLKTAFNNFSSISMREEDIAEKYRQNIGDKKIDVVLDPTLLADPIIYDEIEHINPLPGKKYCFFYYIRPKCNIFLNKIEGFAKTNDLELVIMTEGFNLEVKRFCANKPRIHYEESAGEEKFLGAIKNAKYVFTPSFHGTAFSILYHKEFYSLMIEDGHDTRVQNLLDKLGLEQRKLYLNQEIDIEKFDYSKPIEKLEYLRGQSMDFLLKALE